MFIHIILNLVCYNSTITSYCNENLSCANYICNSYLQESGATLARPLAPRGKAATISSDIYYYPILVILVLLHWRLTCRALQPKKAPPKPCIPLHLRRRRALRRDLALPPCSTLLHPCTRFLPDRRGWGRRRTGIVLASPTTASTPTVPSPPSTSVPRRPCPHALPEDTRR